MGLNPDFSELGENPAKKFRQQRGLSVAKLSAETGVSPQVIRDIEAGQPQTVPFRLKKYFDIEFPGFSIDTQYQNWRHKKRSLVFLPPVGELRISDEEHPFAQYRKKISVSVASFCSFVCVPRFVLGNWELRQRKMPRLLKEVLREAHLSDLDIKKLSNYGEMFYSSREEMRINAQAHGG